MDTTEGYELLAVGVIALVLVVLVSFHYLHRYRMRRLQALRDGGAAPELASDRAFNRIALARREADLLAAQGEDVGRAKQLIDLANRSMETRNFGRAYELAQSAHETLVRTRREPAHPHPLASTPPLAGGAAPPSAASTAAGKAEAPAPSAPPVPKNRAEAQFQLRLFEEDLAAVAKGGEYGREVGEARSLYAEAQAAFSRADYTDALRLSLRGRRRVGGHVETLAPPGGPPARVAVPKTDGDAARSAEELAARERCPSCGHPTTPADAFCRGCGAVRSPTACPRCGASRTPIDAFCGRCGERYDRPAA